ncbi:nicotinate-nucleotide adenylyltransferase [Catalinimonas alkaloidigena]|uniref:Probable nicotinate-nucleotide adenylyltransferase n=1 Tax=Catalinimonas alkaloidigena TaxID=1075417 RepID=A0A1G9BSQ5_9BACT|nr:nicotinate (nicotinamide) nucleotide adenylyltransferase [Catalinimonas alkaloidigena]SDK41985.1 nicotinate-nucleotide adenylyltransferase [Catalinimonas alkaloidigena]
MKVGLFFGSFNPIHIGHLIIANTMVETTDLDQVWFVVSPQNPFKSSQSLLHAFDRYDMVARAVADNYNFKVTDVEFHLPRPSYTIDTLTVLQEKHPQHEFALIMGGDNLKGFSRWKNADRILEFFQLYVYPRPGADLTQGAAGSLSAHKNVRMVEAPLLDISATFIRNCVHTHRSIRYLVPPEVESMIQARKFYQ